MAPKKAAKGGEGKGKGGEGKGKRKGGQELEGCEEQLELLLGTCGETTEWAESISGRCAHIENRAMETGLKSHEALRTFSKRLREFQCVDGDWGWLMRGVRDHACMLVRMFLKYYEGKELKQCVKEIIEGRWSFCMRRRGATLSGAKMIT